MPTCTVDNQGRIVLPAKWRQEQGVAPGTQLVLVEDPSGSLSLFTREQSIECVQAMVRAAIPPGPSLVDSLIAERREEVRKEEQEYQDSLKYRKPRRGKVA